MVLAAATAFVPPAYRNEVRTQTQMNLLGGAKVARTHEEDIELTIAEIMKYAAKMDKDNIVDDDDDELDVAVVGNLISEPQKQEVRSRDDPLEKIKSLGSKIKGKFKKR
ncbi:hypothetical protein ACHAXN_009426 [Cyclotella atomus]|jgi:hypothetical protein